MSKQRAGLLLALGLLALTTVPAMASPEIEIKYVLQCGNAKSVPPDDDDPVLLTRIVAIADGETQNGEIYIRHFVASGENYTRNKQYRDLRFWSEGKADYWSGTSVKYPDRTMVGRIGIHNKRQWIEYVEKHYRGGKLESTTTFACRPIKPEIRDEDWKEGRKGA
jgi:hypothetical protein